MFANEIAYMYIKLIETVFQLSAGNRQQNIYMAGKLLFVS